MWVSEFADKKLADNDVRHYVILDVAGHNRKRHRPTECENLGSTPGKLTQISEDGFFWTAHLLSFTLINSIVKWFFGNLRN